MRCCLCGNDFKGYGNDPDPLMDEGRCCDSCNENVIKFRLLVTMDNLRQLHPTFSPRKLKSLYEDLRVQTRRKCLLGEKL